MAQGGKTAGTSEVRALLDKIDGLDVLKGQAKAAKLSDVNGEIVRVEADLVGLRRMLMQHLQPNAPIDGTNVTLATAINQRVAQLLRLRQYRDEVQALPDDEPDETDKTETRDES